MKRRKYTLKIKDNRDMMSDLPDCVLLHILSFLNAQEAVQTCLLSTRWKHLWKRLPSLTLSDFQIIEDFDKFWNRLLSLRDDSMAVNALNFRSSSIVNPDLLERIVKYAVSHNVNSLSIYASLPHFPPSLLSCLSLTSLEIQCGLTLSTGIEFPIFLNLPALTYLELHHFFFCSGNDGRFDPFSTFKRLNTLILHNCIVPDVQTLYISSTTLLNLSIVPPGCGNYLNIELCAPNLCTFAFEGGPSMKISGSSFYSIEQVTINLFMPDRKYCVNRLILFNWLIELVNIKLLTLTESTLQALSIILLKLKSPSWYNLKSLKLKVPRSYGLYITNQRDVNLELAGKSWKEKTKLRNASKAIDFLLQNSPSAQVDTVFENLFYMSA